MCIQGHKVTLTALAPTSRHHVAPLPHVEDHTSLLHLRPRAHRPVLPSQWETARGVTRHALNGILEKGTEVLTVNLSL